MENPDMPDQSHGDYYCRVCDSHMNAPGVWEAHVTGKKHMKNVKKGETETRYEEPSNPESSIKYELRNVRDPVVGLSYMSEVRKKEPHVPPTFSCFLCHATIATVPLVIEHVISTKHRMNYIKVRNPDQWRLIQSTNLKKDHMEPLIEDAARKLELEYGKGTVKVRQEKRTVSDSIYSKTFNSDDDDDSYQNSKLEKRHWERSRSRSRSRIKDYEDSYKSHHRRSRSPKKNYERKQSSYFDNELPEGSSKRSFSKRDSPIQDRHRYISKRDASPRDDFNRVKSFDDDYARSSRKSDLPDNLSSGISRYHHASTQKSIEMYNSPDHHKSVNSSFLPQEKHLASSEKSVASQHKALLKVASESIKHLSPKECQIVLTFLMNSITKVTSVNEILLLTQNSNDTQNKLKESPFFHTFMNALIMHRQNKHIGIPGIGDDTSSFEQSNIDSLINMHNQSNCSPASKVPASSFPPSASYGPSATIINSQQAQNFGNAMNNPGLGGNVSSSVAQHHDVRSAISQRSVDTENFINNIFQQANFSQNTIRGQVPYQPSMSYTPASNLNMFQARPGNPSTSSSNRNMFQARPGNPSTSSSNLNMFHARPGNPSTSSASSYQGGVPMTSGLRQMSYQQLNNQFSQARNFSNYSSSLPPKY